MCSYKLKRNCCYCASPKLGIRFLPLFDAVELLLYVVLFVVAYFKQETWLAQISIMVFSNAFSCIVKLLGSLSLLKTVAPDPITFETSVWPYKCYFYTRTFGLMINVLSFIAQSIVSALAIHNPVFYDNPLYGVCSFCYKISECKTSYSAFI